MAECTNGSITELRNDLKELEQILSTVSRSNVRQIIVQSISTLKSKIDSLEVEEKKKAPSETKSTEKPIYTIKITSYGWDESSKFVKIYVTLKNIEKVNDEQLNFETTSSSMKLTVSNHMERNHVLHFQNLAYNIKPEDSTCKLKAGNVVLALRKETDGKTWGTLTESQRKQQEAKDSKFSDSSPDMSDPSGGIMNMMKKMYDDGDDDMKRMIKKTWYETQQKQGGGAGGFPGMPGMPGM